MEWTYFGLVIVALLHLTCAGSLSKRFKRKRSGDRECVSAAENLGEILDRTGDLIPPYIPVSIQEISDAVTGRDFFDPDTREAFFCYYEGVSTLSQLQEAIQLSGEDFQLLKLAYTYATHSVPVSKYYINETIQNPSPWDDVDELEDVLKLLQDMEAFGLTDLDFEGKEALVSLADEILSLTFSGPTTPTEPASSLPIDAQCAQLANDLRKVWNNMIRSQQEWDPNASENMREMIRSWTGIELSGHGAIRGKICQLMEYAASDDLYGVVTWIRDERIVDHVLKQGYPLLTQLVGSITGEIDYSSNRPNYYNNYYPGGYRNKRTRKVRTSEPYPSGGNYGNYGGYPGNYGGYPGNYGGNSGNYGGNYGNYGGNYGNYINGGDYGNGYGGDYSNGYGGGYGYGNYNYGGGPDQTAIAEITSYAMKLLENLNDMGLFSLIDDL